MKPYCQEILNQVSDLQSPKVILEYSHPEAKFFVSYDASSNHYPSDIDSNLHTPESFFEELKEWKTKKPQDVQTKKKYLWIFNNDTIQILLEATPNETAGRKCVCHTNITGNKNARLGGELWFVNNPVTNQREIYFNFKSKRYPPQSEIIKLKEIVKTLFICVGYENAKFCEDEFKLEL